VRHPSPVYATFDLEQFLDLELPSPTEADIAIFRGLLRSIKSVPLDTTAPQLQAKLGRILPSNKSEREILINILGYTGILSVPGHAGYREGYIRSDQRDLPPHRFVDMGYPVCWWRGRNGVNEQALRSWFPNLVV
jgi:hypothetical protein